MLYQPAASRFHPQPVKGTAAVILDEAIGGGWPTRKLLLSPGGRGTRILVVLLHVAGNATARAHFPLRQIISCLV